MWDDKGEGRWGVIYELEEVTFKDLSKLSKEASTHANILGLFA